MSNAYFVTELQVHKRNVCFSTVVKPFSSMVLVNLAQKGQVRIVLDEMYHKNNEQADQQAKI